MTHAFFFTRLALMVLIAIQCAEFFILRTKWSAQGPWSAKNLAPDFFFLPKLVLPGFLKLISPPVFSWVLSVRLISAFGMIFSNHWIFPSLIFLTTLLILLRWRGAFNGGSDFISLIVITAITISAHFPDQPKIQLGCLWYIALQSTWSYFMAGWIKLLRKSWRSGQALSVFLNPTVYPKTNVLKWVSSSCALSRFVSWLVIGFEVSFPLIFVFTEWTGLYLVVGALFHACNVYTFGLNRFFWAWISTYPAVYFCTHL
jgi:hypothetical protein